MQELLNIVHHDLDNFDSVCMATSIHTLANLRCSKPQYRSLFESSEMMRLMAAVCESQCSELAWLLLGVSKWLLPPSYVQVLSDWFLQVESWFSAWRTGTPCPSTG